MRARGAEEEGRYLSTRCLKPLRAPLQLQESGSMGLGWGLSVHRQSQRGGQSRPQWVSRQRGCTEGQQDVWDVAPRAP